MKNILLIFFLYISCHIYAQSGYKPLLDSYNEWHVTSCYNGCTDDVYYTFKDTAINGYTYHVLDGYHYISNSFLLREDTIERKVYLLFLDGVFPQEFKLYDFSLNVGDSTLVNNPLSPMPQNAGYYVLDSIRSRTHIDGKSYRYFYLTSSSPQQSQSTHTVWIEGIGSKSLINTPGTDADINGVGKLSCFFSDLTLHYSNEDSTDACEQVNIDLNSNSYQDYDVQLYPNPSTGIVTIHSNGMEKYNFRVFNAIGQEVLSGGSSNKQHTINFKNTGKGIFFLSLYDDQKVIHSEKVVIH